MGLRLLEKHPPCPPPAEPAPPWGPLGPYTHPSRSPQQSDLRKEGWEGRPGRVYTGEIKRFPVPGPPLRPQSRGGAGRQERER